MNPWDEFSGEQQPSPIKRPLQGPRPCPLEVKGRTHIIKKLPATRQPVSIYAVTPEVIQTTANEFKGVVERLTGNSSGNFSPEESLAAIEKTSPSGREMGKFPGILSPAPASLPPISAGMFALTASQADV